MQIKRGKWLHTLVENYLNNEELSKQDVLPVALFTLLKPELDNINNIRIQEGGIPTAIFMALQVV